MCDVSYTYAIDEFIELTKENNESNFGFWLSEKVEYTSVMNFDLLIHPP